MGLMGAYEYDDLTAHRAQLHQGQLFLGAQVDPLAVKAHRLTSLTYVFHHLAALPDVDDDPGEHGTVRCGT